MYIYVHKELCYKPNMISYRCIYSGRNELLGDALCSIAAAVNGIIMVAEDHIIKTRSAVEFLGMIGIFGLLVSSVQM